MEVILGGGDFWELVIVLNVMILSNFIILVVQVNLMILVNLVILVET